MVVSAPPFVLLVQFRETILSPPDATDIPPPNVEVALPATEKVPVVRFVVEAVPVTAKFVVVPFTPVKF